jgi:glycosyltransferase involved in cell wall biosynthesis
LRIALDATYSVGSEPTGLGVYSREILSGLPAWRPDTRFDFYYRPHTYRAGRSVALPPNVRRRFLIEPLTPRGEDLFHGLLQRLPRMRLKRSVATFHDLFFLTGEYSTLDFRARFAAQAADAASRADLIIAVSEFTKSQVIDLLHVEPSRIHVIHHGVPKLEIPPGVPRKPIILTVGAIQKRKNIARLVEAFEKVDPSWRLVLAGAEGYGAGEILDRIHKSAARDRIAVTGYLSSADLARSYACASVFAFPSLDEGFGIPVLEAMGAGIPVVTSNNSALPEVAGDAAILIDPQDSEALAHALVGLTQNPELRERLAAKGLKRAELFTWQKAVQQTWEVYQKLLP